jgi:hypothetical protein
MPTTWPVTSGQGENAGVDTATVLWYTSDMAKTVKPLSAKKLEALITRLYTQNCSNISIDIFDISKIFRTAEAEYARAFAATPNAPESVEELVRLSIVNFVQSIRKD